MPGDASDSFEVIRMLAKVGKPPKVPRGSTEGPLPLRTKSGRKKEPKPKLFGPDIFQWGRGLPREWVGAKKFNTSLETREIKLFGRDIPGFCRDIPEVPEKFEKKKFVFNFRSLLKLLNGYGTFLEPSSASQESETGRIRFGEYGFKHQTQ